MNALEIFSVFHFLPHRLLSISFLEIRGSKWQGAKYFLTFFTFQIVTHQHRILMILDGLSINIEEVDISAPGMEEARDFMRANGKKKEGERHVLPPQIFNGDKYCGVI